MENQWTYKASTYKGESAIFKVKGGAGYLGSGLALGSGSGSNNVSVCILCRQSFENVDKGRKSSAKYFNHIKICGKSPDDIAAAKKTAKRKRDASQPAHTVSSSTNDEEEATAPAAKKSKK